ncbi:MAG: hypothetical protein HPY55_03440 [Firmicutes bacterium]|nr:hypothetical protein [Bacillota bacterium]
MNGSDTQYGERLVSLYSAMLASAMRQRELAARSDTIDQVKALEREADRRDQTAAEIERAFPEVLHSGVRSESVLGKCRDIARQILEIDSETVSLIEQAKVRVSRDLEQVDLLKQYMDTYRGMLSNLTDTAGFIDRVK